MNKMLVSNLAAIVTGGECPECGEGANPTILARFGHCLACQTAAFRGEAGRHRPASPAVARGAATPDPSSDRSSVGAFG